MRNLHKYFQLTLYSKAQFLSCLRNKNDDQRKRSMNKAYQKIVHRKENQTILKIKRYSTSAPIRKNANQNYKL